MDWESFYNHFRKKDFIPGYEILVRLGGGAYGDVYKARKQSIGKSYAIKFLKVEEGQQGVVERELAQVGHFASIDHPNLVTIEDMGVVMGVPYLIMGYAGDQTLAKAIKQGELEIGRTLDLFHQIGRGVRRLHGMNLVHFDLKPGNIFLQGKRARVGDYGLAKFFEKGNQTLSMGRGTPHYMAPEILRGRGDHRSDIYSYGVMLYECLTGVKPFVDPSGDPMALRQKQDPLPSMDAIDPAIANVIVRTLRWEPDARYESMDELMAELPAPLGSSTGTPTPQLSLGSGAIVGAHGSQAGTFEPARAGWVRLSAFVGLFIALGFVAAVGAMIFLSKLM